MADVIGMVLKPGAPEALEAAAEVCAQLPHCEFLTDADSGPSLPARVRTVDRQTFEESSELVIVFGGDGTLIRAAAMLPNRRVPIMGVNLGHIGFLTEVSRNDLVQALELAMAGGLPRSERMRLDVELVRGEQLLMAKRILNDAVLGPHNLSRLGTYRVAMENELVTKIRGDGVIVSTPTGSTAYAMAAGGSILWPELEAVAITPVCPHQLTQRPLVLRPHGDIVLEVESPERVYATCDGQAGHEFRVGDKLRVRRAPVGVQLLSVPWRSYFEMLRTKLHWGNG